MIYKIKSGNKIETANAVSINLVKKEADGWVGGDSVPLEILTAENELVAIRKWNPNKESMEFNVNPINLSYGYLSDWVWVI